MVDKVKELEDLIVVVRKMLEYTIFLKDITQESYMDDVGYRLNESTYLQAKKPHEIKYYESLILNCEKVIIRLEDELATAKRDLLIMNAF